MAHAKLRSVDDVDRRSSIDSQPRSRRVGYGRGRVPQPAQPVAASNRQVYLPSMSLSVESGPLTRTVQGEVEPDEVGLDAQRLQRADGHLARYVDDGRLPNSLLVVSRGGKIAHVAAYGKRDPDTGSPVETDTIWRIYS